MKKSELREIIKPMVEECLQESMQKILLESGLLSAVISEVVAGLNTAAPIVEQRQEVKVEKKEPANKEINTQKINETRNKMLKAIGKDAYGGVNVFEGTKPSISDSGPSAGALKDTDPNDPGVDISTIFNSNWNKLI
jgi:hypothetical protein